MKNTKESEGNDVVSTWIKLLGLFSKNTLGAIIVVLVSFLLGGLSLSSLENFGNNIIAEKTSEVIEDSNEKLIRVLSDAISSAADERVSMTEVLSKHQSDIDTLRTQMNNLSRQIASGTGALESQIKEQRTQVNLIIDLLQKK